MRELEYPFDAGWVLKKKKSIRKELLRDGDDTRLEKNIALLGGSTTNDIKNILELFLLVMVFGMYGPGYDAAEFIYQGF